MCAKHTETELWSTGWLGAGSARNTKDRDVPALEVRTGTPGCGAHIPGCGRVEQHQHRVKVARTSVENGLQSLCSETEAEIRLLLL